MLLKEQLAEGMLLLLSYVHLGVSHARMNRYIELSANYFPEFPVSSVVKKKKKKFLNGNIVANM